MLMTNMSIHARTTLELAHKYRTTLAHLFANPRATFLLQRVHANIKRSLAQSCPTSHVGTANVSSACCCVRLASSAAAPMRCDCQSLAST